MLRTPSIGEEPLSYLEEYAQISISFPIDSVLEPTVLHSGLGGIELRERPLAVPYTKDYDAIPGNRPTDWPDRFDLSNWALLSARLEESCVGGAVIAFNTKGLHMLDGRDDLAVLWDLRVSPATRRHGVGVALFAAAEDWARARGCTQLKVETQNVNVPACRFYAAQGCELGAIDRFAYPEFPEEIQLLWYKQLGR
jgi:GNAT superfamily N-acetyltransferase